MKQTKFDFTADLSLYERIVIAPTPPKYSEVWMTRVNESLGNRTLFISLSCPINESCNVAENDTSSLSENSRLPHRIHLNLSRMSIKKKLTILMSLVSADAVILCHYLTTAVFLFDVFKKFENKVFVYCHGHDVTWNRRVESFPIFYAHGIFYKRRVKRLMGELLLIANSLCTRKKLVDLGFPESDIYLNYLSVDTTEFQPNLARRANELNILYLGRLTDCKGPIETIKSFEWAKKEGLVARLHIVGDGPLMGVCRKRIALSDFKDCIQLHGPVGRVQALEFFRSADIFTAHNQLSKRTNQEEAFGVSVIEAMACGLPIVTGASGGVNETVLDGETGILFPPGNVEAHKNAFLRLGSDSELREKMGIAARERVVTLFDSKKDQAKFNLIFNSLGN